MTVTIKRDTGFLGMLGSLKLLINGKVVGKVAHNDTIELDLSHDEAILHISQGGSRSNKVRVRNGDTVVIKTVTRTKILFLTMFAVPALLLLLPASFSSRPYIGIAAITVIGIIMLASETYKITKIP
ncbi:hypothetical protein [Jeotgalibaca porci]|uniref:hypothetical protein n=1 Tax=Jeotgalibaca porci TaxID=1868793 RepID=UPI0035A09BA1